MRRRRETSSFQPASRKSRAAYWRQISEDSVHATDPGPRQMVSIEHSEPKDMENAHATYPSQADPQCSAQYSYMPAALDHIMMASTTASSSLGADVMEWGTTPPRSFLAKLAQYRSC